MAISQRNKIINKKYLAVILLSFLVLLFPGVPFIIGLILVWLSVGITTIKSPGTGLVGICFMESSYGLVRCKDFDAVLLAGFNFEIVMIFLIGIALYKIMCRKKAVVDSVKESSTFKITFFMFILWFCIRSVFYVVNVLEAGLIFREYILIPLSFFAICFVLRKNSELPKYILVALCLGTALVALVNIIHYFYGLLLPLPRFLMANNNLVKARMLFGFQLNRMEPLLVGLGPGGAGVFYMVHAATSLGCFLFVKMRNFWKFVLIAAFCILTTAAMCEASFSVFIVILLALFTLMQQMKFNMKKIVYSCLFFCFSILIIYGNIINTEGGEYKQISSYVLDASKDTFSINPDLGSLIFLFGSGPAIKTGSLVQADRGSTDLNVSKADQWWFAILTQMGIIGMLLAGFFVFSAVAKYFKAVKRDLPAYNRYLPCAGILFFCLFGYMHGFPLFVQPFNFPFVIALALIITSDTVISAERINSVKAGGALK